MISPPHIKYFRKGILRVGDWKQGWRTCFILYLCFFDPCQCLLLSVSFITVIFKTNEKSINEKSNENFILLPSEKLIYSLKLLELKILQYELLCGEKQKETS